MDFLSAGVGYNTHGKIEMIRPKSDSHAFSKARKLTPASPDALARFDEILRDTAGMWDNEDGERIVRAIEARFESPESTLPS